MTADRVASVGSVRVFCATLLRAAGMPEENAERTAWALVTAEAWGLRSHGLLRLPYYLRRIRAGGTNPAAALRLVSETAATAAFDGENGLGHWQVWRAAEVAAAKAEHSGVAAVSVGNSGHCGSLGLYALPMVEIGLVGLVFSNGPAVMPPWGGRSPVLSTSPLAGGVPTSPRPSIVDLATSAVARGKIAEHRDQGKPLQEGWAFDRQGRPTVDPDEALVGMLAPMGGAKGYALAFLVEALTGAMVGPSLAGDVADPLDEVSAGRPQRISHLVIALGPGLFDVDGQGPHRMAALVSRVFGAGGRPPGWNRRLPNEHDDQEALRISGATAQALLEAAGALGVEHPGPTDWVVAGPSDQSSS